MQMTIRFFMLLALIAGVFDIASAQDAVNLIAEIGSNAVSTAATTSSLANSVGEFLSRVNPVSGQFLETVQRIKALADENAAANNELNAKLQSLLDSFTQTDDNAASIFNGIRNLRMERNK